MADKKPTKKDKKPGFDLDDLFASKKKATPTAPAATPAAVSQPAPRAKRDDRPAKVVDTADDEARFTDLRGAKKRKTTEEGYKVYKDDELRLFDADAGLTDLCPFDCTCCY